MTKCGLCGKGKRMREEAVYCKSCRQKEHKKMEQRRKINENNRLESEIRKFEAWRTSGSRTY